MWPSVTFSARSWAIATSSQVEPRAIAGVGRHRAGDRGEVLGHLGADLVGRRGDARSEKGVHRVVMLEVLQRALEHVGRESPPSGVHDGEGRGVLVDQENGQAVGDQHRDREAVAEVDDDVPGAVGRRLIGVHHVAAVDLVDDDEATDVDADRLGHASPILRDPRGIVVDVVAQVQ